MIKTDAIIIGAGPTGLFAVHQLGIIGLKCEIIDNLNRSGGQCIELYPDKPIYDIPAIPECTGEELTNGLLKQIEPFKAGFHLGQRVEEIKQENNFWIVKTNKGNFFSAPNIIIAGGVGSFEPRKLTLKEAEKFEGNQIFYSVTNKDLFQNKKISIFGGGDSALDWALELSKSNEITLIHRRTEFRGAAHTLSEIKQKEKEGKILIKTPCNLKSIVGDKIMSGIEVEYEGMKSFIRRTDLSRDRAEQRPDRFGVGNKIDVRVTNIDSKTRKLGLSIKAREIAEEKEAVEQYGSSDSGASLGDILGAALKNDDK